jgi:hypothetical protein
MWDNTTTTNWSLTTGPGTPGAAVPTATDNVIFDANSGSGVPFTVTHSTGAACLSLTASALNATMTLTGSSALTLSGSLTLPATNFVKGGTGTLTFSGTATKVITTNGNTLSGSVTINAASATVTLGSALTLASTRTFTFTTATTLDFAGYNVTAGNMLSTGATTRALTLGSGTITLTDTSGTALNFTGATNMTLFAASSTITLTGASASTKTFAGNGYTYGTVRFTGGSTGAYAITGANTFGDIGNTGAGACSVNFPASTTQTLTTFSFVGTAGNLVSIQSATAGTAATLSKASGTVNASYLSIKDNTPTGGALWKASNGTNVDRGNTLGWEFILGQVATGSIGSVTVTVAGGVIVSAANVSATGSIGNVTVAAVGGVTYTAESVSATGSIGNATVAVVGGVTVSATSVSATGSIGSATATAPVVVSASSVSAAGAIGGVTIPVYLQGVSAVGAIGNVAVPIAQTILVTSVYATGRVSSPLVWGPVDTSQTANWVEINT